MILRAIVAAIVLMSGSVFADTAQRSADDRVLELSDEVWREYAAMNTIFASLVGDSAFVDTLDNIDGPRVQEHIEFLDAVLAELDSMDKDALSEEGLINFEVLRWIAVGERSVKSQPTRYQIANAFLGPDRALNLLTGSIRLTNEKKVQGYIGQLHDFSRYIDESISLMRKGIEIGWVQPCDSMAGFEGMAAGMISESPENSFAYLVPATSAAFSQSDIDEIDKKMREAINQSVNPSLKRYLAFLRDEYLPACRNVHGIGSLPGGQEAYVEAVRYFTTDPKATPAEVHEIGLSEVKRIRSEMQSIIDSIEFEGDIAAFFEFMRTSEQFKPKSETHYMWATADIAKRIDAALPAFFEMLPRTPFTIVPVPEATAPHSAVGYYTPGSQKNGTPGKYHLNLYDLKSKSLAELPSLTLHEASPGHHQQITLAQEMSDMPKLRKSYYMSAFGEGWALYSEFLGEEMGIYQTPYESFGRLTFEMWRACRLVVDTGIHAKGWTRQKAIDFMLENTSLSELNIRAEIDRYITWPGQAVSYKYGELKIKELRRRAEKALGKKFNLRSFHSYLLGAGALPLEVLESRVDQWIAELSGKPMVKSTKASS